MHELDAVLEKGAVRLLADTRSLTINLSHLQRAVLRLREVTGLLSKCVLRQVKRRESETACSDLGASGGKKKSGTHELIPNLAASSG